MRWSHSWNLSLELTHWNGNETPDELYADTSTEMALKFALVSNEYDYLPNKEVPATILNNHYDTDGVLSVWTCLEPELALNHQDLLISAAEAGDFAEWTSDDGVKLNFALDAIASSTSDDEEKAYELAVKELPNLLKDFETNQGANYENLWKDSFQALQDEWNEVRDQKKAHVSKASSDFIVTLNESEGVSTLSPLVLYRAMKDKGIWKDTTRILHVYEPSHGTYQYSYEKIGHGWVGKLVERHVVPNVDADCLVKQLNEHLEGFCWKKGGPGDSMLAICTTTTNVTVPPEEIVMLLDAIETQIATDIKV